VTIVTGRRSSDFVHQIAGSLNLRGATLGVRSSVIFEGSPNVARHPVQRGGTQFLSTQHSATQHSVQRRSAQSLIPCWARKSRMSWMVRIFSASSSRISNSAVSAKSSSIAIVRSTMSRESARQVVDQARLGSDLLRLHLQLPDYHIAHSFERRRHCSCSTRYLAASRTRNLWLANSLHPVSVLRRGSTEFTG